MRHTGTQTIATERLTLRRFTMEDAENMYYNWACDPEVTKYLTWQPHKSVDGDHRDSAAVGSRLQQK